METMQAHPSSLILILKSFKSCFVSEETFNDFKKNEYVIDDEIFDNYLYNYNKEIDLLVDNLSKIFLKSELSRKLFDNSGIALKYGLLIRYVSVMEDLESLPTDTTLIVPKDLAKLCKWFFTDAFYGTYTILKS